MGRIPGRRIASTALVLVAASGIGVRGDEPRPSQRDTPFQPGEIAFSASVSPARARPGDIVTYRVTAKLEEPWHVYAYAREQPEGPGPLRTQFDFFDRSGLEPVGDWTASKEPDAKYEHQGEVTWSLRLKVADDAKPGRRSLRAQASYMICDPSRCKAPARSTLPATGLEVLAAGVGK
ncbi:MAG: hypothetical protein U0800_19590 [Isosphaeraceae bacterium]